MRQLINIDNGGTLTDICLWDGKQIRYTKTLTTPFDLSRCVFDALRKLSADIYGEERLAQLLQSTDYIRYSTTQGTNALVQRKGPRLGLLTDDLGTLEEVRSASGASGLFDELVGERIEVLDKAATDEAFGHNAATAANSLTTQGAARLVVSLADPEAERRLQRSMLQQFPRHMLGSVPILYSWELSADADVARRTWSALINAFLHPAMEEFLYQADNRLRGYRTRNRLLIYRNDGASCRVAKSLALKTFSSGPRGGLEATRALAEHYAFPRVLMVDVGGTTTDVGSVTGSVITTDRRGQVEGVPISFELSRVHSHGIGGSSVFSVDHGRLTVGPESVAAAPGPACFGLGGTAATITDVNVSKGVLESSTYLDGSLALDGERSRTVIGECIAAPLGLGLDEALFAMERAYYERIAAALRPGLEESMDTTVVAFGGAGPMSACGAARLLGVRQVVIPRLAAVFSAFGIGFSDLGQHYEQLLTDTSPQHVGDVLTQLRERAQRDMFAEGMELSECEERAELVYEGPAGNHTIELASARSAVAGETVTLSLRVTYGLPHVSMGSSAKPPQFEARSDSSRRVLVAPSDWADLPVYTLGDLSAGASARGPAIVEGPFFTAHVQAGWAFEITAAGDVLLTDGTEKEA